MSTDVDTCKRLLTQRDQFFVKWQRSKPCRLTADTGRTEHASVPCLKGEAEWLEADGLGGFASGTVSGIRTRRYHALLLTALTPPTGRLVLVNGFDAWVDTPDRFVRHFLPALPA